MDKKSKTLIVIFFILLIVSGILTYYRTMVTRDFYVIESEEVEIDSNAEMVQE